MSTLGNYWVVCSKEIWSAQRRCRRSWLKDSFTALPQCDPSNHAKISDSKGVKRPLEEAIAEGDKITAAATQKLASNAPVTDSDIDALLPDKGYETLSKP